MSLKAFGFQSMCSQVPDEPMEETYRNILAIIQTLPRGCIGILLRSQGILSQGYFVDVKLVSKLGCTDESF